MFRFAFLAAVAASLTLAVLSEAQEQGQKGGKPKELPEQKAVRAWLAENTETGKFEEVKWWGPKRLLYDGKPSNVAIRLKYRTANRFGAAELRDDVWEFVGKRIIHHGPDTPVNGNRVRIFGE